VFFNSSSSSSSPSSSSPFSNKLFVGGISWSVDEKYLMLSLPLEMSLKVFFLFSLLCVRRYVSLNFLFRNFNWVSFLIVAVRIVYDKDNGRARQVLSLACHYLAQSFVIKYVEEWFHLNCFNLDHLVNTIMQCKA
jgi:hypothetical protein